MNRDYIFNLNWEDRYKNSYRVGMLAQIDGAFYFVLKDEEKNETAAHKNGYIGIPGFKVEEMYRSQELFDFFKSRVLGHNPCEELAKTRGVSMVDSFSVEEIPERMMPKYRKIILEAYELQEKKKKEQEENAIQQPKKSDKKIDEDEITDI